MRIDLEKLLETTSRLIGRTALEDREIGMAFLDVMHSIATFDDCVIFAYRGAERPIDLFSTFSGKDYEVFVSLYQEGPYLLDPFYRTAAAHRQGIWRMRELAPDRFFSSEYFRSYYEKTGLAEEVGFFVPVAGHVTLAMSLMRRAASGAFSTNEYHQLRKAEPLVAAIARHFWHDLERRFDESASGFKKSAHPTDVSEKIWGELDLTRREIAIIELVLQGHSSESIGLRLEIATGTVKVHRRNIYRKLRISSQTQLLSLYLDNIRELN